MPDSNTQKHFKSDIETLKKILDNPEYSKKIKKAIEAAKMLDVKDNCAAYNQYKISQIKSLQGIPFSELSFFDRIKDRDYLSRLKNVINNPEILNICDCKRK